METKISSKEELFQKILPALRTKKHDLERIGVKNVTEQVIWDYNRDHKWIKATGLNLATMVDDILNTEDQEYIDYIIKIMESGENENE